MSAKKVFFRVDAGNKIGMGHVMRSIALAQGLGRHGYESAFITIPYLKEGRDQIKRRGFEVFTMPVPVKWQWRKDAEKTALIAASAAGDEAVWVITDNYFFGPGYQRSIRERGFHLACIDDIAGAGFCSDLVINHGIHAKELRYKKASYTRLLLGTEYAMLRKELLDGVRKKTAGAGARNLLVAIGGVPKKANVAKTRSILAKLDGALDVKWAFGAQDMSQLYRWADLIFSTASTSALEACYYGLTGVVCTVAKNQERIGEKFGELDAFYYAGWLNKAKASFAAGSLRRLIDDRKTRCRMSENSRSLVDGKGIDRIADNMRMVERERIEDIR